jgi:hypothetical protein
MDEPMDPAMQAKLLSDKRESEFNHHLAGFFVVLAGLFILVESWLAVRVPAVRYVWPVCFLLAGLSFSYSATPSCGHSVLSRGRSVPILR